MEVLSKRNQKAEVVHVSRDTIDDLQEKKIEIKKSIWKNIIQESKEQKKREHEDGGFVLDFGEDAEKPIVKTIRKEVTKEDIKLRQKEAKAKKRELKRAEKTVEVDKPFEELPKKVQAKIDKRKAKRQELKLARKLRVDFSLPEEQILQRYKEVFPD